MIALEKVIDEFNALTDEHKEEVFDFIEFLKQKENKRIEKVADEVFATYNKVFKSLAKSHYSTHNDIETLYTEIVDVNMIDMMMVTFKKGVSYADLLIPSFQFLNNRGFNEDELMSLLEYAKNNQLLLWDLARGVYGRD